MDIFPEALLVDDTPYSSGIEGWRLGSEKRSATFSISCNKDTRECCMILNGFDTLVKAVQFSRSNNEETQTWEFLVKKAFSAALREGSIMPKVGDARSARDTLDECNDADDEAAFVQRMLSIAARKFPKALSLNYEVEALERKLTMTLDSADEGQILVMMPGECTDQIAG
jgi:hypothetical protein